MSTLIISAVIIIICIYAIFSYAKKLKGGCCGGGGGEIKMKPEDGNKEHYPFKVMAYINGMTCGHCKMTVENAFNSKSGIMAEVNLRKKYAEIWSKKELEESFIKETIENIGYTYVKCE